MRFITNWVAQLGILVTVQFRVSDVLNLNQFPLSPLPYVNTAVNAMELGRYKISIASLVGM